MKRILSIYIGILFIIISFISGSLVFSHRIDLRKEKLEFEKLREESMNVITENQQTTNASEDVKTEIEVTEASQNKVSEQVDNHIVSKSSRFIKLGAINSDFVSWMTCDTLGLDYPVMYKEKNQDYYLSKSFYREDSKSGTPFIDSRTPFDDDAKLVIIYGHNLKSGTMFTKLTSLNKVEKIDKCDNIVLETQNEIIEYKPYASIKLKEYTNIADYFYKTIKLENEAEFLEYVDFIKKHGIYSSKIEPKFSDNLLILSTCSYHVKRGRFVLIAIRQ